MFQAQCYTCVTQQRWVRRRCVCVCCALTAHTFAPLCITLETCSHRHHRPAPPPLPSCTIRPPSISCAYCNGEPHVNFIFAFFYDAYFWFHLYKPNQRRAQNKRHHVHICHNCILLVSLTYSRSAHVFMDMIIKKKINANICSCNQSKNFVLLAEREEPPPFTQFIHNSARRLIK